MSRVLKPKSGFLPLLVPAKAGCWTDEIIAAAKDADLFLPEAYFRDKQVPLHLDVATLEKRLPEIGAKRVILTHMSDDMLGQVGDVPFECAEDGMVVSF